MSYIKFGAFCAAMLLASHAAAQDITIKLSEHFPVMHVGSRSGSQTFMKKVEELIPGRVKFEHYPGEQLAKAAGQMDAVRNGVVDLAVVGLVYVTEKMPLSTAVELPGLFTDAATGARAFHSLAQNELLEVEYLPQGLRPVFSFVVTPYQLMTVKKDAVTDIEQIKGLKLRVAGATGELIANSIGAVGVKMSPTDLYLSLDRGVVDGAVANPASQFTYKTDQLLNSWSTNASLGNVAFGLFVNENRWQSLPEDVRAAMLEAGKFTGENVARSYAQADEEGFVKLREAGKTVYELPDTVIAAMNERLKVVEEDWLRQMGQRGLDGQAILSKFREYVAAETGK